MTQLHLSFLGLPQVRYGDQLLTFATRKALVLLIYLSVEGGSHSREKLMAFLWPDSDEKRGRGALRIILVYLRRALETAVPPDSYLQIHPDTLAFNFDSDFTLDTQLPNYSITQLPDPSISYLLSLLSAYRAPFLEGFTLPDAPAFDEWVTLQRAYLHQQLSHLFDQLSQQQTDARQFSEGIHITTRWLAHDPLNEAAHRRLMRLHALNGNKTAALQAYRHCQTILQTELGIEPSPETEALYEKLYDLRFTTYDLAEVPANRQWQLPFVGRSAEHSQLTAVFHQLGQQTQTAVLLGEPGIGKTRLAQEFLHWARLQGADVLSGRAFETGGRLPYQPLVAALRPRLEAENAPEDLLSDAWLAELSRLLPELRDRYPDLLPAAADDAVARTRLLEAIAQLGQALSNLPGRERSNSPKPVILFIDDLQWADAATLDVLHYCARAWAENQLAILILLALRSDHLAADSNLNTWLNNLSRALSVMRLNLGPITAVDTIQLVEEWQKSEGRRAKSEERRVTHSSLLAPRLADWIYHETAGQPFFISETLKLLQEETDIPPHTIVPGVRQLILTRLNRLSAEAMALLTAVAIIGRPTYFEQLCQIIATDEDKMLPALDELLQHQMLLETTNPRHPYTFSHDKIRDIVYTQASDARRRLYHRRALAVLEQEGAPPGELAHHALAAHLYEAAFGHSLAAGDAALTLFAITDAIYHYEQARAVSGEQLASSSKGLLYTNLSRAYELAGNFEKATAIAEEMLNWAQQTNDTRLICAALHRLATLAIYTHQLETAAAHLQQIIQTAEISHHTRWLAEAEWGLAQLAQHRYDMKTAKIHSQHAWQLAQEIDAPELIARSLNSLGYAHLLLGDFQEAITTMTKARGRYLALSNRALEADSLTGMAGAMIFQGRAAEAVAILQEALGIYQAIENPWGILFSSGWLAAGLLDAGRLEETLNNCLQAADHAQTLGPTPVSIWNYLWTGNAYRALFQLDKAIAAHQEAARLNQPHPLRPFAEYIAAELCADYLLAGDWQRASEQAQETLKHRNYQALPQIVLPRWATTAALLQAGHHQQARDDRQQSQLLWGQLPRFRVAHLRSQAVLAEWDGDILQAINYLEEAHNLANEIGLPGEQWQILARLAELYPDKTQQQAAKSQAVEIVNRLAENIGNEKLREGFVTAVATLVR